jgi:hypothetical protein
VRHRLRARLIENHLVTLHRGSAAVERTARVTPGMMRLEIPRLPALNCAIAYPRDAAVAGLP